MTDIILGVIILAIIGSSVAYIYKAKKSGVKCIGCPAGKECSGKSCSGCGCGCHADAE
ncbi:MAG: FeoB-associated Cys-rich membrane protein [Lachnospiraceae bacterium]|nr:FeoB-associated Cys-rich membrane protein [Lachnospiraceae bacterium]